MIPKNITKDHILSAIKRIDSEIIDAKRKERKWAVEYNHKIYPCKLIISYANVFANNGELDPSPNVFTTYMAQDYLKKFNFKIIKLNTN